MLECGKQERPGNNGRRRWKLRQFDLRICMISTKMHARDHTSSAKTCSRMMDDRMTSGPRYQRVTTYWEMLFVKLFGLYCHVSGLIIKKIVDDEEYKINYLKPSSFDQSIDRARLKSQIFTWQSSVNKIRWFQISVNS